jgi:hypothetical protein
VRVGCLAVKVRVSVVVEGNDSERRTLPACNTGTIQAKPAISGGLFTKQPAPKYKLVYKYL